MGLIFEHVLYICIVRGFVSRLPRCLLSSDHAWKYELEATPGHLLLFLVNTKWKEILKYLVSHNG